MPKEHWTKLRSTNPLERANRKITRRSDVIGIHPNDDALIRMAASLLIEQNDEWLVGRKCLRGIHGPRTRTHDQRPSATAGDRSTSTTPM